MKRACISVGCMLAVTFAVTGRWVSPGDLYELEGYDGVAVFSDANSDIVANIESMRNDELVTPQHTMLILNSVTSGNLLVTFYTKTGTLITCDDPDVNATKMVASRGNILSTLLSSGEQIVSEVVGPMVAGLMFAGVPGLVAAGIAATAGACIGEIVEKANAAPEFDIVRFIVYAPTAGIYSFAFYHNIGPLHVSYSVVSFGPSKLGVANNMMFAQYALGENSGGNEIAWNRDYDPAVINQYLQPVGLGDGEHGIMNYRYLGPSGYTAAISMSGPAGFTMSLQTAGMCTTRIPYNTSVLQAAQKLVSNVSELAGAGSQMALEGGSDYLSSVTGIPVIASLDPVDWMKLGASTLADPEARNRVMPAIEDLGYAIHNNDLYRWTYFRNLFQLRQLGQSMTSFALGAVASALADFGDAMVITIPNAQNGATYSFRVDNPLLHPWSTNILSFSSFPTFNLRWKPGSIPSESKTANLGDTATFTFAVENCSTGRSPGMDDYLLLVFDSTAVQNGYAARILDEDDQVLITASNPDTCFLLPMTCYRSLKLKVVPISGEPGTLYAVKVRAMGVFGQTGLEKTFNTWLSTQVLQASIIPDHSGGNYNPGERANFVINFRNPSGTVVDPDQINAYFPTSSSPVTLTRIGVGDYRYQTAPLTQGTDTLRVVARKNGLNMADVRSDIRVGTSAPAVPTGLAASPGDRQIVLNWTPNPSGTHRYRIYRSLNGGGSYSLIDSVYHPTAMYTNTGLTSGTTYYYKISAVNSSGQASALSGSVSGRPQPPNGAPSMRSASHEPSSPTAGQTVVMKVTYSDPEGEPPAWVDVVSSQGGRALMTFYGPLPRDYRAGVTFQGGMTFSPAGSYSYWFEASDGRTTTRYPTPGNSITVSSTPPEQPLRLDSIRVSPKIISPLVSPDTADRCTLSYKLSADANFKVVLQDGNNTNVRTLLDWSNRADDTICRESWDGRNDGGTPIQDGGYFFKVQASNFDRNYTTLLQGTLSAREGDVATDTARNRVYVSEIQNDRIRVYNLSGSHIRDITGLDDPKGIAVQNSTGYIYVADFYNKRVVVMDEYGNVIRTLSVQGSGPGQFVNPYDVDVDVNANVYVLATKALYANPTALLKYRSDFTFVSEDTFSSRRYLCYVACGRGYVVVTGRYGPSPCAAVYDTLMVLRRMLYPDRPLSPGFGGVCFDPSGCVIAVDEDGGCSVAYKYDPSTGELLVESWSGGFHIPYPCNGAAVTSQGYFLKLSDDRIFRCQNGWAQAIGQVNPLDPMQVQVDNSPPLTDLNYPDPNDSVSDVVRTIGTALDANFKQYALEYSSGADPESWSLIKSDSVSVDSGPLGDWNTNPLPNGDYGLRLYTADDAYNLDSVVINVHVNHTPPGVGIDTVYPPVFSPNGDGITDTFTLGYSLSKSALVSLTVLDANDAIVRTLASGVPKPGGANTAKWDGKNNSGAYVGDGQYRILLVASDSVNNPSPAETALVTVDRTRPTLALTAPVNNALLAGLVSFTGTATDANPGCREMLYGLGASPDSWTLWDSAGSVVVSGLLAMMYTPNVTDSFYSFKLFARDEAGNQDSVKVRCWVDNSKPAPPVLCSPADTSAFRNRSVRFIWNRTHFAGVRELNPDSVKYTLQLSRDYRFISCDTTVNLQRDTSWQCPWSLADTAWYWHVRATDSAGNVGYYQNYPFQFDVDNVSPTAPVLLLPADSSQIIDDTLATFTWHGSAETGSGIRNYTLRLSNSPDFLSYRDTLLRDTMCVWRLSDSVYYWKTMATDRAGNTSGFQTHPFRFVISREGRYSIAGGVRYYSTGQPAVDSAQVIITGATSDTVVTDVQGAYSFPSLVGLHDYLVSLRRQSLAREPAVSSYDAALVLQHAAGRDTLDSLQFLAGDVTGDSTASAFDAGLILRYVVGWIRHFPAGAEPGGDTVDWTFRPPSRLYDSLMSSQLNQDYRGVLYGDPSGNWMTLDLVAAGEERNDVEGAFFGANLPEATRPPGSDDVCRHGAEAGERFAGLGVQSAEPAAFRPLKPDATHSATSGAKSACPVASASAAICPEASATTVFPIRVGDAAGATAADMLVGYDSRHCRLVGMRTTRQTEDFMLAATDRHGLVRVGLAGARKLDGEVTLLELLFESIAQRGPTKVASDAATSGGTKTLAASSGPYDDAPAEIVWLVLDERGQGGLPPPSDVMGDKSGLPGSFYLSPPTPNPFGDGTRIDYGLPGASSVRIGVFDATGRAVCRLVHGGLPAGRYTATWDGRNALGQRMSNGIYFVRMEAGRTQVQRRVTLLHR